MVAMVKSVLQLLDCNSGVIHFRIAHKHDKSRIRANRDIPCDYIRRDGGISEALGEEVDEIGGRGFAERLLQTCICGGRAPTHDGRGTREVAVEREAPHVV